MVNEKERRNLKIEWGKIQVREMCHVNKELGKKEKNGYFAAGICPFLVIENPVTGKKELSMLLVREMRNGSIKLNFLGGKRESGELPNDTAYREFLEETGGLVNEKSGPLMQLVEDKNNQRLWVNHGRYILISVSSPAEWVHLPSRFERRKWVSSPRFTKNKRAYSDSSELTSKQLKTKGLVWVSVRDLIERSINAELSEFLKSIVRLSVFKEFAKAVKLNPEYRKIRKYFENRKWMCASPAKSYRDGCLHNNYHHRRQLKNDRWGHIVQGRKHRFYRSERGNNSSNAHFFQRNVWPELV